MSQSFKPPWGVLENKVAMLFGNWAIGAVGAVGAKIGGTGLTLTRTGVGLYTVQLVGSKGSAARVNAFLFPDVRIRIVAGVTFIGANVMVATASTGAITIATFNAAGTAADPPNPSILDVVVYAKLSSAVR